MGKARPLVVSVAVLMTVAFFAGNAAAQPDRNEYAKSRAQQQAYLGPDVSVQHHDGLQGHLPPKQENVALIGESEASDPRPNRTSDVAYLRGEKGRFAYTGRWTGGLPAPECTGGVDVYDINDPTNPQRVNFLPQTRNTYVTEGLQALHVETRFFTGDLLLISNEACGPGPKGGFEGLGGITIWDITDPRRARKLVSGVGDTTLGEFNDPNADTDPAHEYHSIFGWTTGGKVFAVATDNEELLDVDFWNLTDPRNPKQMSETGDIEWPNVEVDAFGDNPMHHDTTVEFVNGHWTALVSYWDAGWVLLNVDDPKRPRFIDDTNYLDTDPYTGHSPPEGNGHYGEFSRNTEHFVTNDEDFSPFRLRHEITTGPHAGEYGAGEFGWTVPITTMPNREVNGPTVFGGYGCPDDRDGIPTANQVRDEADPGPDEELILVMQRGPVGDPNDTSGACFFSEKVETAQLLGYDAAIVANHHSGSGAGANPDAFICGSQGHQFTVTIPGICIGHREMHLLFDQPSNPAQTYPPDYTFPYPAGDPGDVEPDIGDIGWRTVFAADFDGWGYNHLFETDSLTELDQYAVSEGVDEDFAVGFGDLTVHEVAMEKSFDLAPLAYYSYYNAGFRVTRYARGNLREIGAFIDDEGSNFWGVELAGRYRGKRLVAASDMDFGLQLFQYSG
jgi:hypothetical protein